MRPLRTSILASTSLGYNKGSARHLVKTATLVLAYNGASDALTTPFFYDLV